MATRRDGAWTRRERLQAIAAEIASRFPGPVRVEDILDWIEMNLGLTRRTGRDYIETVIRIKGWIEDHGVIKAGLE